MQSNENEMELITSIDGTHSIPLATAAALDSAVFSKLNASESIPASWDERAKKAWEYYLEEPLVKNCVNSWRVFAVGDEVKIACDDEAVKEEAEALAYRLKVSTFVKDMVLQLLVKGDAVGFKRYTEGATDLAELVCVNPVSVKVKYVQGQLVEARQKPDVGREPSMGNRARARWKRSWTYPSTRFCISSGTLPPSRLEAIRLCFRPSSPSSC